MTLWMSNLNKRIGKNYTFISLFELNFILQVKNFKLRWWTPDTIRNNWPDWMKDEYYVNLRKARTEKAVVTATTQEQVQPETPKTMLLSEWEEMDPKIEPTPFERLGKINISFVKLREAIRNFFSQLVFVFQPMIFVSSFTLSNIDSVMFF
jgi:hypothetical protein